MKLNHIIKTAILSLLLTTGIQNIKSQITWPENQLLPSFPASATTQDFLYMNGSIAPYIRYWTWQAETAPFTHKTGKMETDGWVCQTASDTANYMICGAIDSSVTMGPNVAEFKLKVSNISLDDNPIVDIDIRYVKTGAVLASQTITRKQFTAALTYQSFKLPFMMPADSQALEMRVYWRGTTYTKLDMVGVTQDNGSAEAYLFSSMKGIVNRTKPRIFTYEGDASAEGAFTWLKSLGLNWIEQPSGWNVLAKYRKEISGIIVYDPTQIQTVNLATLMANQKNAIIASPSLVARLTASPYYYPILGDLRGKFKSKLEVYQYLYDNYWPNLDKRILIGLNPEVHKASLREYATAVGVATIWLDPLISAESAMLGKFLGDMPLGANYMGWWTDEAAGVSKASSFGIATIASDFCTNLSVHSGMSRTINIKPMQAKPVMQNKIYVAFILSDGDNLQFVEHLVRKLWNNADRGSVPMGWTMSPAMVDAMPGALNYYYNSSTANDNIISGPSGYGYTYPNAWTNQTALNKFVTKTEEYNNLAGMRVLTVWNTITGGVSPNVGQTFATYAPSLLGVTAQNTGGALSVYKMSLPVMPLSCNYCTTEQAMKDHIANASTGWLKNKPKFVIIQAQPWTGITPTSFKNVMNSLSTDYIVVRPDQLFQLMREANKLSVNPGGTEGIGSGLIVDYFKGSNFDTLAVSTNNAVINADWAFNAPVTELNADSFSVRWRGKIQPRYSGNYTIYITSDENRRVWIDNQLIIDKWNNVDGTYTANVNLVAGQKYDIKVEYADFSGTANCKLEWASPMQSREAIPATQLYDVFTSLVNNFMDENSPVKISPNPVVNGELKIEINKEICSDITMTIFDLYGKSVYKNKVSASDTVNIGKIPTGNYIVALQTKENNFYKKIVVL